MDPSASFANWRHDGGDDDSSQEVNVNHRTEWAVGHLEAPVVSANSHGWRKVVLNFTPSWFAVNMGTGIVSILLFKLPYNATWIYWISIVFFCLNIALFLLFLGISALRYIMFKGLFRFMIRHPVQSLFLGTFPMGLATIVNMVAFVCVPAFGSHFQTLAWVLWWIDAVVSVATCFYLPFIIMYVHGTDITQMTAAWLLPVVSTIVAAASGGIVASVLTNATYARITIITSYVLLGTGLPLALLILVIYFFRLTMYHLPPREQIVSVFLPLGPLGQGSFALMQLGRVSYEVPLVTTHTHPDTGEFFYNAGLFGALLLWGYGLVWLFFALASITRQKFPFNMGWWGFIFPMGVYTIATINLGLELESDFFRILGTIFALIVLILWLIVSSMTCVKVARGTIFVAPCVKQYEAEREKAQGPGMIERT